VAAEVSAIEPDAGHGVDARQKVDVERLNDISTLRVATWSHPHIGEEQFAQAG